MKVSQSETFQELSKILQVQSQKPSSVMIKLALMRYATGKEDPDLPLLQRINSFELPASEIAAQIYVSEFKWQTSQHKLFRHCVNHGQIATKKPLLQNTNKKKRLAWAKKHEQRTLDRWKSVLWTDEFKFQSFGSNRSVFLRHKVGVHVWFRMCGSHREAWRRRCDGACWWHCLWFI